jgi:hypothetical protein
MKADDGAPLHVDGCIVFYVLFRSECPFGVLPWLVELPDAESSSIDGNVLSLFETMPYSLVVIPMCCVCRFAWTLMSSPGQEICSFVMGFFHPGGLISLLIGEPLDECFERGS